MTDPGLPVPGAQFPTQPRHRLLLIAGATLAVCILAAAGYFWYRSTHPPTKPPRVTNPHAALTSGDLDGALTQIDQILAANPKDVQVLIIKSLALAQKGNTLSKQSVYGPQAADAANQAIALDGMSSEAYRALGYANEIQQKYVEAHAAYQKAIALDSKNANALYGDAHAYDLQGEAVKAEAGYKAALALDSKLYSAYLGIGRAENAQGNASAAIDAFKQVYNYDQNTRDKSEASYSIGMLLMAQGPDQVNLARGYFEKAIYFDPSYPSAYVGQGIVLYAQATATSTGATLASADIRSKLLLSSASALQKALKLDPNQTVAYMQLSLTLLGLGQKEAALGALTSAKQALPHDITLSASEKAATLNQIASLSAQISTSTLP
jgi:tetratricopeptide (TPR) repeat protein